MKNNFKNFQKNYWPLIKANAKSKNIKLNISIEYAWLLFLKQNKKCAITNKKIKIKDAYLNKINLSKNYIHNNMCWIHKNVKSNLSQKFLNKYKFPTKVIALSGGMDCVHSGHIKMINEASKHGIVTIFLNSDEWLLRKKGYIFQPFEERKFILENFKNVDLVMAVNDDDNTVCAGLEDIIPDYFGNGGDRKIENVPELDTCKKLGITPVWNLGGEKTQSSSWIIQDALLKIKTLRKF